MLKKNFLWIALIAYCLFAVFYLGPGEFKLTGVSIIFWIIFAGFVGFTLYCSSRENFFKALRKLFQIHWGRQVVLDLYIGLSIQLYIIYLNEPSFWKFLIWILPVLVYGNIITLLYWALNGGAILSHFLR